MKKSGMIIGLVMLLLLTGCTQNKVKVPGGQNSQTPPENTSVAFPDSETTSEKSLKDDEQIVKGAAVINISCGYLSSAFVPEQYVLYLISNEEEIAYAEIYLGMQTPLNADEIAGFNNGLAAMFQQMKEDYPVSDYNYLLQYLEYSQGGHYHHADNVVYSGDKIYFHYDVVKEPEGEVSTDVMEGDFIMAAVPKTFFDGKNFNNVARYGIPLTIDGENIAPDNDIKEGYIAKFENGNPDYVTETFVYMTDKGYKCLHSHNAYILGESKWRRTVDFYQITPDKEGVIAASKKIGSYDCVIYPGDEKHYNADHFADKVFVWNGPME